MASYLCKWGRERANKRVRASSVLNVTIKLVKYLWNSSSELFSADCRRERANRRLESHDSAWDINNFRAVFIIEISAIKSIQLLVSYRFNLFDCLSHLKSLSLNCAFKENSWDVEMFVASLDLTRGFLWDSIAMRLSIGVIQKGDHVALMENIQIRR